MPDETSPAEAPAKVTKGLQTWVGYGLTFASVAAVIVLALLQAADAGSIDLPPQIYSVLLLAATVLGSITGRNRSDQAAAITRGQALSAPMPPIQLLLPAPPPQTEAPAVVSGPVAASEAEAGLPPLPVPDGAVEDGA